MQGVRGLQGIEEGVRVPSMQSHVRVRGVCSIDPREGSQVSFVPWGEHLDHENLPLICYSHNAPVAEARNSRDSNVTELTDLYNNFGL